MSINRSSGFAIAVALAAAAFWAPAASAQESQSSDDSQVQALEDNVEDFLKEIGFGNARAGLADLLTASPLLEQSKAIDALQQKLQDIPAQYGEIRDSERISTRRIGSHVVLLRYLVNCEKYPLVLYVTYYRAFKRGDTPRDGESWVVVSLRCDSNVELLALEK